MEYVVIGCALLALIYAVALFFSIRSIRVERGELLRIAGFIRKGTFAFLKREYLTLAIFIVVIFIVLAILLGMPSAVCFACGSVFSMLAGFMGMNVATCANVRTAQAAEQGMKPALKTAFRGGSVMGMSVVGLGLLGVTVLYLIFREPSVLICFGFGGSFVALFARVGGGIYTKAADVGADLVGKVEAGIPEDDPRNPAVIADNVGDNVGDVAGMGADLFESYVGAIVSALTLAAVTDLFAGATASIFVLLLAGCGILASILSCALVGMGGGKHPQSMLRVGTYASMAILAVAALLLSYFLMDGLQAGLVVIFGLVAGGGIGLITEYYTSADYKPVKEIARQSLTGSATNIISGLATGMKSTLIPILIICLVVWGSYTLLGLLGVALAAVGMLAVTGSTVAVDAYGPIADNAGGIAEMTGLEHHVREVTDQLDAAGNTTAAMGKGFAIGSAALTALALFASYAEVMQLKAINLVDPYTIIGVLIGGVLPFVFSALTMDSVGRAANAMIEEVRRQFAEKKGIMQGTEEPDYARCVDISTKAALVKMIVPGLVAVLAPIVVGLVLGKEALGGLLCGALVTGVMLAIFMANAGGAWDNAKKYIEEGQYGGKKSDAHKASVTGDTVGDPFKDTSGPSLNILIKLMTIVALVVAPLLL